MAYTPNDAISLVGNLVHGVPVSAISAQACDIVNSMMWRFYPWGWTIKSFTPINLVDGTQDYTPSDNDILRPLKIRLVRTDVTPNEFRELALLANLSPELTRKGGLDTITSAGWYSSGPFIRLLYAASISGTQTLQIQGEYQFTNATITNSTLSSAFSFPDRYFNVFVEGLKWQFYYLTDDPRAGGSSYQKNGNTTRSYTGQLGAFMEALLEMGRTEDLGSGDEFMFPESPLGMGRSQWPGLFQL